MIAAQRLSHLVMNEDGFVFDPTTADSFVVNASALTILQGLQEGRGELEILDDLTARFCVTLAEARNDLADFLSRLKTFQLI